VDDGRMHSRGTAEQRHESANGMLQAYRERRRRRRGEDTYFGSTECLFPGEDTERRQRRSEIVADAQTASMPTELAELLYEIAEEEGLDPGLAFDLVRSGLGVAPPEGGVSNAPEEPMVDRYLPEWFFPALAPDDLLRERMLRMSIRRIRSLLERYENVEDAFRAFADEPDVGYYGY
jgi:hypothetical protein